MHSIAKPILIITGAILALYATSILCLNIYLQSDGVQKKLRQAVGEATGIEPRIDRTYYTPWSGLTISGLNVPQGENTKKALLSIRSIKFNLSLSALFQGHIFVTGMTIEDPSLLLVQGQSEIWPLDSALPFRNLKAKPASSRTSTLAGESVENSIPKTAPASLGTPSTQPTPEKDENKKMPTATPASIGKIKILHGQASFYQAQGGRPIRLDGLATEGKVLPDGSAQGVFQIKTASFADSLRISNITGNFEYREGQFQLTNLRAEWAKGLLQGSLLVRELPDSFFEGSLTAENVSLQKLAEDAGFSAEGTQGVLVAKANVLGDPNRPDSITGEVSAFLTEARMQPIEPIRQLGELLRINELSVLELRTAETKLSLRDGKILITQLALESANLLVDATGEAKFDGTLDMDARFHVSQKLLTNSLGFMGSKFKISEREGYSHVPFSITGTITRPKSNLLDKLVGARIGDDVGGLLKNLLRLPKKEKKKKEAPAGATPAPTN